jgi:pyruvate dehydrogenase E2 component (dihydrolipoamide acetyltransferase)
MRYIFQFPDIGEGIEEGRILKWYVNRGQAVGTGEALLKVETDKVVTDIPSPREGTIVMLHGRENDVIHVGDALVELEIAGVDGAAARAVAADKPPAGSSTPVEEKGFGVVGVLETAGDLARLPASDEGVAVSPAQTDKPGKKSLATPLARAMAREAGLDIDTISGSGPGGRVTRNDITAVKAGAAIGAKSPEPPDASSPLLEYLPLSRIRKTIARRMALSTQTAAHMTLFEEVEVSPLMTLRAGQKERLAARSIQLTYLPFIIKAVVAALRLHPELNSVLDLENERIIVKHFYHIGIAVDTAAGLTVPVIRDADRLSIVELAQAIATISEKARKRELKLEDIRDGTFTITNFGALGGSYGVPVINTPEVGILGVGRISEKPVVQNSRIEIGRMLPLSLAVDHRLIDGSGALKFLQTIMKGLSNPVSLMID